MALETNLYGVWGAKQSGKGAPAAAPSSATTGSRLRLVAGDLAVNRDDGSENYSDAAQFGDAQHFVNTIIGQGSPGFQATPKELAWLCWLFNGQETVNPITGPPVKKEHVGTPSTGRSYSTWWKTVGASTVERLKFNDCVLSQLEITAGTGQRIMRVTPQIFSLDPGEKYAVDPSLGMPGVDAFVYQEAAGAILLNGSTLRGTTQYTITLNKALEAVYGDDVRPIDLQPGNATVAVTATIYLDTAGFALANYLLYGTDTPTAGAKPTAFVGDAGAFEVTHTQKDQSGEETGNIAKFEVPGLKWSPPDAVAVPNPDGGGGTLELTGGLKKVAGQPAFRSTVTTDEVAFTA